MEADYIADLIGYCFANKGLLHQALTHRSHSAPHNERLEFLGDAVLNCAIAEALFNDFPLLPEGDLSRLRAHLVNQQSLHEVAQRMDLGRYLLLGEGEIKSGGLQRPSILADAFEALIGAVFIDGGYGAAQKVVDTLFEQRLKSADPKVLGKDPKTLLQELLQSRHMPLPQYAVVATSGEAHCQIFRIECAVPALAILAEGEGPSRRIAEQAAAQRAYDRALSAIAA
jgi:ribonuclease-3